MTAKRYRKCYFLPSSGHLDFCTPTLVAVIIPFFAEGTNHAGSWLGGLCDLPKLVEQYADCLFLTAIMKLFLFSIWNGTSRNKTLDWKKTQIQNSLQIIFNWYWLHILHKPWKHFFVLKMKHKCYSYHECYIFNMFITFIIRCRRESGTRTV